MTRRVVFKIIITMVGLAGLFHFIVAPNPSSIFFSPDRFTSIFYSQESIEKIFAEHAAAGMNKADLDRMILNAGGKITRFGYSAAREKSPGFGYGHDKIKKLEGITANTYVDYSMPNIGISNLSPGRVVTAHYDKENRLVVLFVNHKLFIPKAYVGTLPDMHFLNQTKKSKITRSMINTFPPGTAKKYVEEALINKAGTKGLGKIDVSYAYPDEQNVYGYEYRKPFYLRFLHDGRYIITIFYDQNDRVKDKVKMIDGRVMEGILISGPSAL